MPDSVRPTFKWEWNINTIAMLAGFVGGFITWGYTLAEMRNGQEMNAAKIIDLQAGQAALVARVDLMEKVDAKQEQLDYRLAQAEKGIEATNERIGRISESYSNQFSDMRTQLSTISTQVALTNQSLNRIEAVQNATPRTQPP